MSDASPAQAPTRPKTSRDGPLPRGKARVHSRFVRVLRVVLPIIMIAVVGVLATLVGVHAVRRHQSARVEATAPIRMVNPHFFGRDNRGRAYTLGASQASRDEHSFQKVLLQNPALTLDVGGPHPSNLTADLGVYMEDTRMLYLKGHVRGANDNASRVATDQAVVDTRTGVVNGASAIDTNTPLGALNSRSFDVYNKGDRVIFKGGVHARLNQH